MTSRTGVIAGFVFFAIVLGSCRGAGSVANSGSDPPSPGPGVVIEWLAAVKAAKDPNDLDAETRLLQDAAGGAIVVSPAACFSGIPERFADGYLLGLVAPTKAGLDELLEGLAVDPLFEVRATNTCID